MISQQREGFLCKCCLKQSVLKRMWILERYKGAHTPEHLSISSSCWCNKRLLRSLYIKSLFSRGSTSDTHDTVQTPNLSNCSFRQRLPSMGQKRKGKKNPTQHTTKVWRMQTTKVHGRMVQIKRWDCRWTRETQTPHLTSRHNESPGSEMKAEISWVPSGLFSSSLSRRELYSTWQNGFYPLQVLPRSRIKKSRTFWPFWVVDGCMQVWTQDTVSQGSLFPCSKKFRFWCHQLMAGN